MLKMATTQNQLVTENKLLRDQLETAEETLRDILSGEADALFVSGVDGAQLFTLKGADQSYQTLIENMSEGALTLTPEGLVLYANRRFAEMLGTPLEMVIGSVIYSWFAPETRQVLLTLLRTDSVDNRRLELALAAADGTQVPVYLSVSRIFIDETHDYFCMVMTDLTEQKHNETIIAAEKLSGAILEQAADAIVICDEHGRIIRASKQAHAFHGKNLLGELFDQAFPLHKSDGTAFAAIGAINTCHLPSIEASLKRNGNVFDFLVSVGQLKGARNELLGSVVTLTDITDRKRAEIRMKYLNRVYAMLSGINILIVRERDVNELYNAACRIAVETGRFRMALICIVDPATRLINLAASAGKDEKLLAAIKQLILSDESASKTMVARAIREKTAVVSNDSHNDTQVLLGSAYAEAGIRSQAVLPLIIANEAIGVIALYSTETGLFHEEELNLLKELAGDIAFARDIIEKQAQTDYLAYYDVLTGLANRTLFLERVSQYLRSAIDNGHKLAVVLVDIERFKNINDSLGRLSGDSLLRQVAEWMIQNAGGDASLLARIGADHFALVLPEVRPEGNLAHLFEKIMKAFADHPFHVNDAVLRITAKLGVAIFPDDGASADILYMNAEAALKKAKSGGERYLFYTQKMTDAVAGNLTLENQLRRALDNGEFVLHYQPKVNLKTGKVTSAEGLIRWNDPQTGLVPPGRFIPILEETGLIYEVGRWVIYKAVEDYLRWCNTGLAVVPIAVNVSSLQLRHPGFIAEVGHAIGVDARAAGGLELEITESLIMEDIRRNITSLQAIRDMGIRVAIDDFGTGFSSLSYLAKLPIDTLKIDRSFIIEITNSPEGLALVSTIINLAHSLRLLVVAEGVETEEQSRLLSLLNCDEIQGYLFSKPLPVDVFETKFLAPLQAG